MKTVMLAAWVLSIATVLALAVSLADLHLRPAMPLQPGSSADLPPLPGASEGTFDLLALLRMFLMAGAALLLLVIVINALTREGRRRLLSMAAAFLVLLLVQTLLSLVPSVKRAPDQAVAPLSSAAQPPPAASAVSVPFEPQPPRWLPWVIVTAGALLAVAGATGVILVVLRRRPRPMRDRLAGRSAAAAEALGRGAGLKGVILRCYRDMVTLVEEERGISRGTAVTPSEFAARLESAGLPAQPVRDLTCVFEEVRYGNAAPLQETEQRAIRSLRAIVRFCGESP